MAGFDPMPGRHPRLAVWTAAFVRAGWKPREIAKLFDLDTEDLIDEGAAS